MLGLGGLLSFLGGTGTLAGAIPGMAAAGLGLSALGGSQRRRQGEGEFDPRRMESAPDYVPRKFNIFVDPYTGAYYNSPEDRDKAIAESRRRMGIMAAANGGYIRGYNVGGFIEGPGTGTSDSIPARLSDGEYVFTAKAVRGAGNGNRDLGAARMYDLMSRFEGMA